MNPLANPLVRIAIGAALSTYISPKIINRFMRPELEASDERLNDQIAIGITAATTTLTFVLLGMLTGKSGKAAADVPGVGGGK